MSSPKILLRKKIWISSILAGIVISAWYFLLPYLLGLQYEELDLTRTDIGNLCELRKSFGSLSQWGMSEFLGLGQPLFADPQMAILYPPRWVSIWLSSSAAVFFQVAFHLGFGVIGFGRLLGSFRIQPTLIFFMSLIFGLSGIAVDYIGHSVYILDLCWLPWFWFFARNFLYRSSSADPALFSCLGAVACFLAFLLGGEPQALVWCMLIFAVEWVESWLRLRRNARLGIGSADACRIFLLRSLCFSFCLLGAVLMGMLQWLPTFEEFKVTARGVGFDPKEVASNSLGPMEWLEFIIPNFGSPSVIYGQQFRNVFSDGADHVVWVRDLYLGSLTISLVGLSLIWVRRSSRFRIGVILALLGLLLSLGSYSPNAHGFDAFFFWLAKFRYPQKNLVLFVISAQVLASLAVVRLRKRKVRNLFLSLNGISLAFLFFGFVWLQFHRNEFDSTLSNFLRSKGLVSNFLNQEALFEFARDSVIRSLVLPLIIFFGFLFRSSWVPALVGMILLDLGFANFVSLPLGQESYLATQKNVIETLRDREGVRAPGSLADEVICVSSYLRNTMPVGLDGQSIPPGLILSYQKMISTPQLNACFGHHATPTYSPLRPLVSDWLLGEPAADSIAIARTLGCTVFETMKEVPSRFSEGILPEVIEQKYEGDQSIFRFFAYRISDSVPMASIVRSPFMVFDSEHLLDWFRHQSTSSMISRVQIERPGERLGSELLPNGKNASILEFSKLRPDRFDFRLEGQGGAILQLRESFAMGWEASQMGHPLRVLRSAGQFLGVLVDDVTAGQVIVEYHIPRLRLAFALASLGVLIVLISVYLCQKVVRRSSAS